MPEGHVVRLRYGNGRRLRVVVPTHRRGDELRMLAGKLMGQPDEVVRAALTKAAEADAAGLAKVAKVVAKLAELPRPQRVEQSPFALWTIRDLGEAWCSGALAKDYPDSVRPLRDMRIPGSRLQSHVYPEVGEVLVKAFTLSHYERVMRSLQGKRPSQRKLSPLSRRTIALTLTRLLSIAVYPLRLLSAHPVPRGAVPHAKRARAASFLYPDEDLKLCQCTKIPLPQRAFWGFLVREGCRVSEALGLCWADVDLKRGAVRLDRNKTDDPRAWALSPGVAEALRQLPREGPLVFPQPRDPLSLARELRAHLRLAGVARSELHAATDERMALRVHDLRGSFVTIALASGRSEAWVCDRTGHKSSQMIATYKRAARTAAELGLGDWAPLNEALRVGQGVGHVKSGPAGRAKTPTLLRK